MFSQLSDLEKMFYCFFFLLSILLIFFYLILESIVYPLQIFQITKKRTVEKFEGYMGQRVYHVKHSKNFKKSWSYIFCLVGRPGLYGTNSPKNFQVEFLNTKLNWLFGFLYKYNRKLSPLLIFFSEFLYLNPINYNFFND